MYCPSCGARSARPENIEFHATAADAKRAGFRPCKRCKPDQLSLAEQHAETIAELCRLIENADQAPTLEHLANRAGLSAFHLHRLFKAIHRRHSKQYAAAHRAKRVKSELDRSNTVTDAIYGAGYNSNGRFYEQSNDVLGMTPTTYACRRCEHRNTVCDRRVLARLDPGRGERAWRVLDSDRRRS